MKKIKGVLITMLLLMGFSGYSQVTPFTLLARTANGVYKTLDTTINADTTYLTLPTNKNGTDTGSVSYPSDLVVSWTNTTISGSTAGTVIYQGSETGVFATNGDWVTLVNDKNSAITQDTTTVSGTTRAYFVAPNYKLRFFRIRYISSGTQTSVMTGKAWIRRRS